MQRNKLITGICPVKKKEVSVPVPYIYNGFTWEKGIGDCPHSFNCTHDCPIIKSAPEELDKL